MGCVFAPGPELIKLFSCSTQLSMKFFLLINVKMPTIVGILTFMSRKNSILGLSEPIKAEFLHYFYTYELVVVVVVLLFYVHGKHLRSCRDGQLT